LESHSTQQQEPSVPRTKLSLVSDQNGHPSRWSRFLAPSVTDLFFAAILLSLSCGPFGTRLLNDAGIGWHIRNGQQILLTHAVPRTDSFSVTMSGHSWYAWEWLYDLLIAGIHNWLGLNGVVFVTACVIALTFSLALKIGLKRGGSLPLTMALLVLSIAAASIHFLARPHVLSWLFAVIWFQLVDSDAGAPLRGNLHRLFWYPLLMVLWVNLHGGFLLAFVLFGIFAAGLVIEFFISREVQYRALIRVKLNHLAAASLLSFLASLINPYGFRLYGHLYEYLTNRFLMDHIDEFLSPNFHGGAQQCFAALLLITLVALAGLKERPSPPRFLVIVFAAYSGLYSTRNLPVSSILLALIMAPILSNALAEAAENPKILVPLRHFFARLNLFSNRMGAMESNLRGHIWALLAFVLGFVICMHGGKLGKQQWMDAQFSAKRFPVQATKVIAQSGIHDPIFCPDYWGGYLIYRLYPQSKVFIDDRHDLYGDKFLRQYLQVLHVGPRWSAVLDQWQVNWVLTPRQSSLANILKESRQWKTNYEDETAIVFERTPK
jgi:hypothetical protein